MKIWRKTITVIATFALLFNSIVAPFAVLAQEVDSTLLTASPTPEPTDSTSSTPLGTSSLTTSPEATVTPDATPAETASPTPQITPIATDLVTPTPSETSMVIQSPESNPTVQGPPASDQPTATPTLSPEPQIENPTVTSAVVTTNVFPETVQSNSWFKLITDKLDYTPTEIAIITGSDFTPNETYSLTVSSMDDPATSTTVDITTDDNGGFTYNYQLDGNYRPNYKVDVQDGSGKKVASTTFTDSDPPNTEFDSKPSDTTNSTTATFYFHATEPGSTFQCSSESEGLPWSACTSPKILTGLSNGTHNFFVKATGTGGTGTSISHTWVVNTSLEIVTVTAAVSAGTVGSNSWYTSNVTVSFTCSSTSGTVTSCPVDEILSTEGSSVSSTAQTVNDDGGNTGTSNVVTVKIDKTAPVSSFDSTPPSLSNSSSATFNFHGTDAVSGIDYLECELDGGEFGPCESPVTLTGLSDGSHTFQVRAMNLAGLLESTASYTWTIDTSPPNAAISYSKDPVKSGDSLTITATFNKAMADSPPTKIAISGGNTVSATSMAKTDATHYFYTYTVGDGNGTATVVLSTGTDVAGNVITSTPTSGATFTVDNTVPTITAAVSAGTIGSNGWYTSNVTVHFTCSDGTGSGIASCPADQELSTESSSVSSTAQTTTDNAGNISAQSNVVTVKIDQTVPGTPSASPVAGDYTSDQSVTLSSSDTLSGLGAIYYTTDGEVPNATKTLYSGAITVDKDMTIKAIAYDNAGNAGNVLEATYGIAPVISGETSSSATTNSVTITWTTDDLATSRVIYDTVSHSLLGAAPNYGYANSTVEDSTKVTSHSVGLSGLTEGTTYYYRTVSHGSPETVSDESSFTTSSSTTTGSSGGTLSDASAPSCNDTKPGSAPILNMAVGGVNSVTLYWTAASDPVTYYLVTYGETTGAQTYGNPNVGGKGTTSYTVSGLSGGTTYYFKVRAGNGCAPGDYSSEVFAIPIGGFINTPAVGFIPGVLGTETEALASPSPSAEILGTEASPTPEPVNVGLINWVLTHKKISLGVILVLAAIGYFISKQKKA